MGKALRTKLRDRLCKFACVYGITLTLDGELFSSPEEAWRYVMKNRLLSVFVKKLHDGGFLNSRDYFWVVEWQEETQQAHWHLLVDAHFVPFGEIVAAWSSFRPKSALPLPFKVTAGNYKTLERPAFGSVRFSMKSTNPWTAAGYATKYVVKVPDYGFPDWVLDYVGRVPRYGHSRGFFAAPVATPEKEVTDAVLDPNDAAAVEVHDDACFCEICRGEDGSGNADEHLSDDAAERSRTERRELKTLRERLSLCRNRTTLVRVPVWIGEDGREVEGRASYVGSLDLPFLTVCAALDLEADCTDVALDISSQLILSRLESDLRSERLRREEGDEQYGEDW